jgi:hypothetical protein
MKRNNTPDGRRYQRDAAVARGDMIQIRQGDGNTLRLSRGKAEVISHDRMRLYRLDRALIDGTISQTTYDFATRS